jgi:hypothetical protein
VRGFPRPDLANADPVVRQAFVANDPGTDNWAAGFIFTTMFVAYRDTAIHCTGELPWGVSISAIPHLTGNPRLWIAGIAIAAARIFVLGRDAGSDELSVIDVFRMRDCSYLGSIQLPGPAKALAGDGDLVAVELEDSGAAGRDI